MKFIGSFLLGQLANLVGGTIEDGFLRIFANGGHLYTKQGSDDAQRLVDVSELQNALAAFSPFRIQQNTVSDSSGITICDFSGIYFPQFFVNGSKTYSTLRIDNVNGDDGTIGLLFIKMSSNSNKLRLPTDRTGYLLASDDV